MLSFPELPLLQRTKTTLHQEQRWRNQSIWFARVKREGKLLWMKSAELHDCERTGLGTSFKLNSKYKLLCQTHGHMGGALLCCAAFPAWLQPRT